MNKKVVGIWYRYDDGDVEYIENVSRISIFEFNWLSSIIKWFKREN
tara:strand:- start:94 stop:231 length:138 start_codon:yes stop_codon:yes gene_type:complete